MTDEVARRHLSGVDEQGRPFVAGVYPMLLDERCFFLAVDFDGGDWAADAQAYLETGERLGLPAVLERSRSRNLLSRVGVGEGAWAMGWEGWVGV